MVAMVDPRNPINWAHPLNRGLVNWWLPFLQTAGGQYVYDAAGLNKGTLISMGGSSNGWRGSTCPGAIGPALLCDGSAGYVNCGTVSSPAARTYIIDVLFKSLTPAYTGVMCRETDTTHFDNLYVKSNGKLAVYVYAAGGPTSYDGTGLTTLVVNKWYQLGFSLDSTNGVIAYVNGQQDHAATGAAGAGASITASLALGTDLFTAGRYMNGLISNAKMLGRSFSAAEFAQHYNLSRVGYLGMINRIPLYVPARPATGGPFPWFTDAALAGGMHEMGLAC